MKKLQRCLRRKVGMCVSLQDPDALTNLVEAVELIGGEELLTTLSLLRDELRLPRPLTVLMPAERDTVQGIWESRSALSEVSNESFFDEDVLRDLWCEEPPILRDVSERETGPAASEDVELEVLCERVSLFLAEYCGPISRLLLRQVVERLECPDIRQDYERVIDLVSGEIDDKQERAIFRERCHRLMCAQQ